jgi:hypothetical protein
MADNATNTPKVNPLLSIMRQPKIYITLPSGGKYWTEGSLNPTVNGEFPVFSMTARDEIVLKTPDALMNGQGVVDVIQSCIPNVINAWAAPQIDLDIMLVAIRLATYGESMTLNINHSTMEDSMDYNVNLRELLERLLSITTWEERFEVRPDLIFYLKPIDYRTQTLTQISDFETQRLMSIVHDTTLDEPTKLKAFTESFEKLTNSSMKMIYSTIFKIESSAGTTDDPEFIQEFMKNCDAEIYEAVKHRLEEILASNKLPDLKIPSTPEMLANGAPAMIEVPFTFDAANFFG